MTPPNVLVTPKPESSVMMSRTLGAPFFGVTFAGQKGCDLAAMRSICPPNFDGGGGSCLPSIVVVAAGDPGGAAAFVSCPAAEAVVNWPDATMYPTSPPTTRATTDQIVVRFVIVASFVVIYPISLLPRRGLLHPHQQPLLRLFRAEVDQHRRLGLGQVVQTRLEHSVLRLADRPRGALVLLVHGPVERRRRI